MFPYIHNVLFYIGAGRNVNGYTLTFTNRNKIKYSKPSYSKYISFSELCDADNVRTNGGVIDRAWHKQFPEGSHSPCNLRVIWDILLNVK